MYVWKLWRDSRSRFLICLALGVAFVGQMVYMTARGLLAFPQTAAPSAAEAWHGAARSMVGPAVTVALLAAIFLGAVGMGQEFASGTAELLLTRPRRRRYFIWSGWTFGALQLLLLLTIIVSFGFGLLCYLTHTLLSWRALALVPLVFPSAALLYGITYALSVGLKNSGSGQAAGVVVFLLYLTALTVLDGYWKLHTPAWWFANLPGWALYRQAAFPTAPLIGWGLLALVFPLLAQWSLRRKEA